MNGSGRRRMAAVAVGLAAFVAVSLPASARGQEVLRSGTIVSGVGETQVSLYVRGMEGCAGAPTCAAWLQSACHPALVGTDHAVHAAIVDVAELADGTTERTLEFDRGTAALSPGHFIVQFWDHTYLAVSGGEWEWCSEILDRRMSNWDGATSGTMRGDSWTFEIPERAHWMTITSSPDNLVINWQLG